MLSILKALEISLNSIEVNLQFIYKGDAQI